MRKDIEVYWKGNLCHMRWEGGGEIPVALKGAYTSPTEAMAAYNHYLSTRRVRKNGKGNSGDK